MNIPEKEETWGKCRRCGRRMQVVSNDELPDELREYDNICMACSTPRDRANAALLLVLYLGGKDGLVS